jgi:hypothetical protein
MWGGELQRKDEKKKKRLVGGGRGKWGRLWRTKGFGLGGLQ